MLCEVEVRGELIQVDVFQNTDMRWTAQGMYLRINLIVHGRSEARALLAWQNAATYRAALLELKMELDGTLESNLVAAIRSARRLRGHPVYADTMSYWTDLLHQARRELTNTEACAVAQLIVELEMELAERPTTAARG